MIIEHPKCPDCGGPPDRMTASCNITFPIEKISADGSAVLGPSLEHEMNWRKSSWLYCDACRLSWVSAWKDDSKEAIRDPLEPV